MDSSNHDEQILNLIEPDILASNHHNWTIRSQAINGYLVEFFANPSRHFESNREAIYTNPKVDIIRVPIGLPGSWIARRYKYEGSPTQKKDIFRKPLVFVAFEQALAMEEEGIRTPKVLAAGVEYKLFTPQTSYLVGQEVKDSKTLGRFAARDICLPHNLATTLAKDIGQMHMRGLFHGDLTINNILIDGKGRPWFIDLDRGFKAKGSLSWKRSIQDLHRLARFYPFFSHTFRIFFLDFLEIYSSQRGWQAKSSRFINDCLQRASRKRKENDHEKFTLYSQKKNDL